ncbi:TetR/AcrR family transcriptional regulator C-terminal domain-containing protein [Paraconexibacter antarcticus]|uniref:TetR/AcrR family transcriptional regulator C-terminal domain-containing protein n=1 Tax=Paraconexibacter antarcticus TaxID=2949664 RepID=A0ABY5DM50_9ACTN|nr:TetR/AcrR family transcriptional regulator C-terminal domain-containing protein [Paraconexibacter antarcticus]UTI63036.1 TetR/AcrR family transcriptional regulator C-terminal domain-containing protein [Paraconexibacter antarcticus]
MPTDGPTTRRAGLSRERVLDAARTLIERDGAGALTMRRLGREVGVEAMSLYNHVSNRDAVLDGLGEFLMSEVDAEPGADWRESCRDFAAQLRAIALTHPATFSLVGLRPLRSAAALAPVERLLQNLVAAGAAPDQALAMYRTLASFARGYAMAEVTGFTVDASTPSGRRPLRALPRADFPILRERLKELEPLRSDAAFTAGLDAMLDGFAGGSMRGAST